MSNNDIILKEFYDYQNERKEVYDYTEVTAKKLGIEDSILKKGLYELQKEGYVKGVDMEPSVEKKLFFWIDLNLPQKDITKYMKY